MSSDSFLIDGYPKGSNIMLLNTIYHRTKKEKGEYTDYLSIVYKDLETNEKKICLKKNPKLEIYFTKKDIEYDILQPHIPLSDVEAHIVENRDLLHYIAEYAGEEYLKYYFKCIKMRKFNAMKNLFKYRYVHSADIDIEDFHRIQFLKNYKPQDFPIDKSYLDIEIDLINSETSDVQIVTEEAQCPINVVTIIHEKLKKAYTFILRNPNNPQVQEFEDDVVNIKKELNELFDADFGHLDYEILFYDDELQLIKDLFININIIKPDFCLIWNMSFDIRYIINRIIVLGGKPEDIMCHPDFVRKECFYNYDSKHFKIQERGDYFKLSSYTLFTDQMINYANIRKGENEVKSFKLNYIAKIEINDNKLDYSEEGNIKEFPYKNFKKFVIYNIKDVLLEVGIDNKTDDMITVYERSYFSGTRYQKIFRQSIILKNYAHLKYPEFGYILGDNHNSNYDYLEDFDQNDDIDIEDAEKFEGAIVGNPLNNMPNGVLINGIPSKYIFDNSVDLDYSHLYPAIRDSHNVDITTQWGRVIIDQEISDMENAYDYNRYDRGGNFLDDLQTGETIIIGTKWFGLPSADELLLELNEIHGDIKKPNNLYKSKSDETMLNLKGLALDIHYNLNSKGIKLRIDNLNKGICINVNKVGGAEYDNTGELE